MDKKVYSQLAEGFELLAAGYRSLAEQGAEATPEAAPEPTKKITIEQVRAVMSAKSDEGKTAQVKALLMKYDAGKLSGVKPEDYADLLREVEAL
ncbi:DNA ligase [Acutalibacter sp. JLR.KK004]|uniref:DNA ligase n=1 Tax=Acutalibacter sp. JLR.KK004 TaxID=3112622 RepID=UPI002FF0085B